MTPNTDIHVALRQAVVAGLGDLPLCGENLPFEKPANSVPWAAVFLLPNQPSVATLGPGGEDAHDGILQVDLNYPLMTGTEAIDGKADELASVFPAGTRLTYGSAWVRVTSCGRSRGREVDGWYRVSITIAWAARVTRN